MRRLFGLVLLLGLSACSAGEPGYVGAWEFVTSTYGQPGSPRYLQGTMIITRKDESFDCSLQTSETAFDRLPGLKVGEIRMTSAQQSCQVVENEGNVIIQGKVISSSSQNYQPDSFDVTLDGDRMQGRFSSVDRANVTFVRKGSTQALPPIGDPFAGLVVASRQDDRWVEMGSTNKGCKYAYKTPVQFTSDPVGIRVWMRFECGGTTNDGKTYASEETQSWFLCGERRSYDMAQVLLDKDRNVVNRWVPTMFGFEITVEKARAEGLYATVHQSDSVLSQIAKGYCA